MDSKSLSDLSVWVTRPGNRGETLCRNLRALGARCVAEPVMSIQPLEQALLSPQLDDIHELSLDGMIVVSGFAAEIGIPLLVQVLDPLPKILSVGAATQSRLRELGVESRCTTPNRAHSEGLLELPELGEVSGQTWLIVKGEGGRTLLADTLTNRGATVYGFDTYRRVGQTTLSPNLVRSVRDHTFDLATVTSVEIFEHLWRLLENERNHLERLSFLVPGNRVAEAIYQKLPSAKTLIANGATDKQLVERLLEHQQQENPL